MKRFDLLAASLLTTAVALGSEAALAEPPQLKPNVVVIMTDDIGWGTSVLTAAVPCAAHQRRISTGLPPGHALRQLLWTGELHGGPRLSCRPFGAGSFLTIPGGISVEALCNETKGRLAAALFVFRGGIRPAAQRLRWPTAAQLRLEAPFMGAPKWVAHI